jgi:hypothetical protein
MKKPKKRRVERLTEDAKDNLRDMLRDAALKYTFISGETGIPVYTVRYWARKWKMRRIQVP